MNTAFHQHTEQQPHRPASEANRQTRQPKAMALVDNRPEAIAQRQLDDAIHHSPHMVAQRQQLRGLFGEAAQLKGPEDEELLQGKFAPIQRKGPEEEELLQGKFNPIQRKGPEEELQMKTGSPSAPPAQRANNTGLPDNLKSGIESLSGMSMDHVKVHYNSSQPAQLNALAYAQGTDIHVSPGQEQHLPHEAWHVVQQAQGRVKPTMQMKDGVPVNNDQGLERDADVMGERAAEDGRLGSQQQSAQLYQNKVPSTSHPTGVLSSQDPVTQMKWVPIVKGEHGISGGRKHYYDGWGDSYRITEDNDLIDTVEKYGELEEGQQEIELGTCQNPVEHISKYCNILFENYTGKKGDDMTNIYHCGPASR